MKYDFTTMPDRTGRDALAVDAIGANVDWAVAPTAPKEGFSKLPMWVADMNFATVPTIPEAIIKRAEHPLYGYYIPTQSVSEDAKKRTIAVYAPSKTFNLAGLIGSYHIIYDSYLRDRVRRRSAMSHYNAMNVLSMHALIGAYQPEGHEWVDELNQVLSQNVNYAVDTILQNFDGIEVSKPEGTYMMFLHCEEYCKRNDLTIDELIRKGWDVGVAWQQGAPFHDPWGIRMNLALPYMQVVEAFDRLKQYVF